MSRIVKAVVTLIEESGEAHTLELGSFPKSYRGEFVERPEGGGIEVELINEIVHRKPKKDEDPKFTYHRVTGRRDIRLTGYAKAVDASVVDAGVESVNDAGASSNVR